MANDATRLLLLIAAATIVNLLCRCQRRTPRAQIYTTRRAYVRTYQLFAARWYLLSWLSRVAACDLTQQFLGSADVTNQPRCDITITTQQIHDTVNSEY